jgi:hypothetical protein
MIWESDLDDKYKCTVERTSERTGLLRVVETGTSRVLLEKQVGLSYGAQFGPDMADVAEWQELCVEAVDSQEAPDA